MLPEIVLFTIVRVLPLDTPPPVLPEMVLFSMVTVLPNQFDKPPKEDPPVRVTLRSVKFPRVGGIPGKKLFVTKMRPKSGAFAWRAIVAPLPSIVIWLVIRGKPTGLPNWPWRSYRIQR